MGSNASFPRVRLSKDRIIVVTGATSGLGYEVAKWCAMLGATVILACRSEQKTNDAIERINQEFREERAKDPSGLTQDDTLALEYMHVELSSFKSVVSFTEEYKRSGRKLHVLFLNAAHGLHPYRKTEDCLESVLQVNYLSQFLIVTKLLPVMKQSGDDCRILFMTSLAHRNCTFDLDTINYEGNPGNFQNNEYYSRSKLYQVMQMFCMLRRLKSTNIAVNSVNPGVAPTNFGHDARGIWKCMLPFLRSVLGRPTDRAAISSINCAVNPDLRGTTGQYFNRECRVEPPSAQSRNEVYQEQLWEETFKFLKDYITEDERAMMEGKDAI